MCPDVSMQQQQQQLIFSVSILSGCVIHSSVHRSIRTVIDFPSMSWNGFVRCLVLTDKQSQSDPNVLICLHGSCRQTSRDVTSLQLGDALIGGCSVLTGDEQSSVPARLGPAGLQTHESDLQLLLVGLSSGEHAAVPGFLHHDGDATCTGPAVLLRTGTRSSEGCAARGEHR